MSQSRRPHGGSQLLPLLQCLALLLSAAVDQTAGFPEGAPNHRCSNLVPMHGFDPQASTPPFELTFSPSQYSPGDVIQVTLRALGTQGFLGFALAAHRLHGDTEELVGGFEVQQAISTGNFWYSQNSSLPNCLTHAGLLYTTLTARWIAPSKSVGDVAFTTPVVRSFRTYWANVTSSVLTASVPSADPTFPPMSVGESPNPLGGSCGTDFGCVRSPALCDTANCEILVRFLHLEAEGRLRMVIHAHGSYVSVGLSDDDRMEDDLTLTCSGDGQTGYSMQLGYNPTYKRLNERHRWTPMQDKYIEKLTSGRIRCEFTLPLTVNISTYASPRPTSAPPTVRSFDLRTPRYIFIAYGTNYPGSSSVQRHAEMPAISNSRVDLLSRSSYSAHRISGLRRAHGSLMLAAWQLLVPLGANLAMFYRTLFMKSFGGVQLWFHLHRGFMVSGFLVSIIGVLLIFAEFGWKWSYTYTTTQTHGAMGLTIICLATVQIVMGVLRPDKDAPRRPLFKYVHQGVASSILGLADATIITIGFLWSLPQSYRIAHTVFAFTWLAFHLSFRIGVAIWLSRYVNKMGASDAKDEKDDMEARKEKILRFLFIVFLVGMLIIFLAWFVILMLF